MLVASRLPLPWALPEKLPCGLLEFPASLAFQCNLAMLFLLKHQTQGHFNQVMMRKAKTLSALMRLFAASKLKAFAALTTKIKCPLHRLTQSSPRCAVHQGCRGPESGYELRASH